MSALACLPYVVSNSKSRRGSAVHSTGAAHRSSQSRMRVFLRLCFTQICTNRTLMACVWTQIGLLLIYTTTARSPVATEGVLTLINLTLEGGTELCRLARCQTHIPGGVLKTV